MPQVDRHGHAWCQTSDLSYSFGTNSAEYMSALVTHSLEKYIIWGNNVIVDEPVIDMTNRRKSADFTYSLTKLCSCCLTDL